MKSILLTTVLLTAGTVAGASPFTIADDSRVPGATLVQDVDSPARNPYQETASGTAGCSAAGVCGALFPVVTHRRVVIQHVSCEFVVTNNAADYASRAAIQGSGSTTNYLKIETNGKDDGSGFIVYTINSDVLLYVNKGTAPAVYANSIGAPIGGLTCTITGFYIT